MGIDEALRAPADAHGGAARRRRGDRARPFLPARGRGGHGAHRHRRRGRARRRASSPPPSSATGSTTAARWRSRSSSSSTGTGSPSAARTCAASIRRASSSLRPRSAQADKRRSPAPGGATGLQIRVGPSDGLRWVRLPSSSATPSRGIPMTPAAMALVAEFEVRRQDGAGRRGGAAQADGRADRAARAPARFRLSPHAPHPHPGGQRGRGGVGARAGLGRAAAGGARRAGLDRQKRRLRRDPGAVAACRPGGVEVRLRCRRRGAAGRCAGAGGLRGLVRGRARQVVLCAVRPIRIPRCPLSTSEPTEFDEWLASMVAPARRVHRARHPDADRRAQRRAAVLDLPARDRRRGGLGRHHDDVRRLRPELGRRRVLPDQGGATAARSTTRRRACA